jgi:dihydropteroate synthase
MPHYYLRPMGLFMPAPADPAQENNLRNPTIGLPLSNTGIQFNSIEVAERYGKSARRYMIDLVELFQRDWPQALDVGTCLDRLTEPRPRFAGLTMDRPRIMGIVNVTPDSFSDGGRHDTAARAIEHGLKLVAEGADILDIGGESTRPGSDPVPQDEELRRVIPVIEGLRTKTDVRISVDTRKAEVMRRAAKAGADILNDVSALTHDPDALDAAAATGLSVILMHSRGDPKTMNDDPKYSDLVLDVYDYLEGRVAACEAAGIPRAKICVDPGIGFAKHLHHNVQMMAHLSILHGLGVPVLLGASRKKMIAQLCDVPDPKDRLPGSLATVMVGAAQGMQILRVHDVAETKQALSVWLASTMGREPSAQGVS